MFILGKSSDLIEIGRLDKGDITLLSYLPAIVRSFSKIRRTIHYELG